MRNLTQSNLRRKLFEEITQEQFKQKFGTLSVINSGTQGKVFKGNYKGQKVAIKEFKNASQSQYFRYIASEIMTLNQLNHQNIIKLINCYKVQQKQIQNSIKYYMVMQFCQASLNDYALLADLSTIRKLSICKQIVSAIDLAHQNDIMHRDIKPENVLIKDSQSFQIKVCDFGCSRKDHQGNENLDRTSWLGTPLYKDPNIDKGDYTNKCDVYSLGLIIMYIFFNKTLFSHAQTRQQLSNMQIKFSDPKNIDKQFQTISGNQFQKQIVSYILKHTLNKDQRQRFSCSQLQSYLQEQIQKPIKTTKKIISEDSRGQISAPQFKKKKTEQVQNVTVQSFQISHIQRVQVNYLPEKTKPEHKSGINQGAQLVQNCLKRSYNSQKSQIKKDQISKNAQQFLQNQTNQTDINVNNQQKDVFVERFTATGDQIQNQSQQALENYQRQQSSQKSQQKSVQMNNKSNAYQKSKLSKSSSVRKNKLQKSEEKQQNDETRDESMINEELMKSLIGSNSLKKSSFISTGSNCKLDNSDKMVANLIQYSHCIDHKQAILSFQTRLLKLVHYNKKVFNLIKPSIENINFINNQAKQGLAFMYHLLYFQFLQNIIRFVNKKPSTISRKLINEQNVSSDQIMSLTKKFQQIVNKEKKRIRSFIVKTAQSLQPRVRLIQPKLTDFMIKQIRSIRNMSSFDPNDVASLQEAEIKEEIEYFLDQRVKRGSLNGSQNQKMREIIQILKDFK